MSPARATASHRPFAASYSRKFTSLRTDVCPFVTLPEARSRRWGQGLTKGKMAECQWLQPMLVGQFEFLEWTADNHLRHSSFVVCAVTRTRAPSLASEGAAAKPDHALVAVQRFM